MSVLHTDFIQDGGTFMVITEEQGIHSDRLSQVQCNMLSSNRIPHLLDLHVKEVDFRASLHYNITGLKMLTQGIKSERIRATDYYMLLLQTVTVLDDCKRYMLRSGSIMLDDEHVFYEEPLRNGNLHFTYTPLKEEPNLDQQYEVDRFLGLAMKLMTCVDGVEGTGIQQIVEVCSSREFSYGRLRKLLLQLIEGDLNVGGEGDKEPGFRKPGELAGLSSFGNSKSQTQSKGEPIRSSGSSAQPNLANFFQNAESPPSVFGQSQSSAPEDKEIGGGELPSKIRTYTLLAGALIVALLWKFFYMDQPSSLNMGISGIGTLLVVAAVFAVLTGRIRVPLLMADKSSADSDEVEGLQNFSSSSVDWNALDYQGAKSNKHEEDLKENEHRGAATSGRIMSWLNPDSRAKEDSDYKAEAKWRWNDHFLAEKPADFSESPLRENPVACEIEVPAESMEDSDYYSELGNRTELLSSPKEATVLLGRNKDERRETSHYLERREAGVSEQISLKRGSFVIGRSEEVAQYVERTLGTSRAHVELLVQSGKCTIKDLGSKNGTQFKGEPMVPYKDYILQPGDTFTIASVSYIFR